MEDTLRDNGLISILRALTGLNPCFNGRYSQRWLINILLTVETIVLILVLMEDTLREQDIRIRYISGIGIYKPKQIGFY